MSLEPTMTAPAAMPSATRPVDDQSPLSMKTFTVPITLAFTIVGCVCIGAIIFFLRKRQCDKRRCEQEEAERTAGEDARIELSLGNKVSEPRLMDERQFGMLHVELAQGQLFCAERTAREPDSCAVCLVDIQTDDCMVYLPCDHGYHQECVRLWLVQKSERCPLCKKSVLAGLGMLTAVCSTRSSEYGDNRMHSEG